MTLALIGADEYDRSSLLNPNHDGLSASFRLAAEKLHALSKKGYKAYIGTAANLDTMEAYSLGRWLRRALNRVPALIPQVWLRRIYDPHIDPKADPLREDAYSRVDFVVFWNGRKAVIEIDGPEHYAEYDRIQKSWKISEEIYTKNLKRERLLKQEGWLFFRLSNQEVENADSWHDIEAMINLESALMPIVRENDSEIDNLPYVPYFGWDIRLGR